MERMKALCKERNELYKKQNDLRGQKQQIESGFEWQNVGAWQRSCPQFVVHGAWVWYNQISNSEFVLNIIMKFYVLHC